jgi:hypothetical protein
MLQLALEETNRQYREWCNEQDQDRAREQAARENHSKRVEDVSKKLRSISDFFPAALGVISRTRRHSRYSRDTSASLSIDGSFHREWRPPPRLGRGQTGDRS